MGKEPHSRTASEPDMARLRRTIAQAYTERKGSKRVLFNVLFRIHFPPKLLTEILRPITYTFQVVQIFCRDALQYFPHTRHGNSREVVAYTRRVNVSDKVPHQLSALGFAFRAFFS